MAKPTPVQWNGLWVVDLRAWGFGQRYRVGAPPLPEIEAVHRSYALLERLRSERAAEPRAQLALPVGAPPRFAAALDQWEARKEYKRDGSKRWGSVYARLVRGELGAEELAGLAPPAGNDRLHAYVRTLRDRGLSARTIRNRVSIAMQVLHFAAARGWTVCPERPPLPERPPSVFWWVNEPIFRAIRDGIFSAGTRCAPEAFARRRAYLSWLFYTGCHTADADGVTTDVLFLDGGSYIRHNHKSARVVPDEQFEMPEPLIDDLRALERALGRELLPGEPFAGGPWPHVARIMGRAARRLGVSHPVNPRVLRRSFAREMFQRGYTEQEVADRMGHVDLAMLHEVYVRTPRPAGVARSKWKRFLRGFAGPSPDGSGLAKVTALR